VHGDKQQSERDAALASFVNKECPYMFATDVAARGLDIKGVSVATDRSCCCCLLLACCCCSRSRSRCRHLLLLRLLEGGGLN